MQTLKAQFNPSLIDSFKDMLAPIKKEAEETIELIEQKSDAQVRRAIQESKTQQMKSFKSAKEKQQEREGLVKHQYKKVY